MYVRTQPRGFTMLELIVTVAAAALILAMVLTAVSHARRSVDGARNLATMRQHLMALRLYANDHEDHFPFFGTPGAPELGLEFGDCRIAIPATGEGFLFYHARNWVTGTAPYYSTWRGLPYETRVDISASSEVLCGGSDQLLFSPVFLTHTVCAPPSFWQTDSTDGPSALRGMRFGDVRWPSRKGILIAVAPSRDSATNSNNVWIAWADGSVDLRPWHDRMNVVRRRPGMGTFHNIPCMTTEGGLKGTDY